MMEEAGTDIIFGASERAQDEVVIQAILSATKLGQKVINVIEIGSGPNTIELLNKMNSAIGEWECHLYTIEHDIEYQIVEHEIDGLHPIFAPMSNGWYSLDKLIDGLPDIETQCTIFVDGPPTNRGLSRNGIISGYECGALSKDAGVVFDDCHRDTDLYNAVKVARYLERPLYVSEPFDHPSGIVKAQIARVRAHIPDP